MIRTVACPAFLFVIVLFSWAQTGPALEERLAAHRNLGKAFYENPTTQVQSVDEFSKALALSPKSVRERVNYGLALLRAAKTDEGIAQLKLAQAADAGLPQTWFNLGIQYKRRGETAPALEQLRKARELAPRDAIIHYNIAVLEKMDGVLDRAIAGFEKASLLDPNLAAPHFQLFNALRQNGRGAEAQKHLAEFQRLKKDQEGAAIAEDMEWSLFSEVIDVVAMQLIREQVPYHFEKAALPAGAGFSVAYGNDIIAWNDTTTWLVKAGQPPRKLPALVGVKAIAVGDYDNDGVADLCVVTRDEAFLSKGFTKGPTIAQGSFEGAVWLDYDHDYDLDLILLGSDSKLLRNQGAAGFVDKSASFPFVKGRALGAVTLRVESDTKGWDLVVSYEDREAVLYRDMLGGVFKAETLAGVGLVPDARDVDDDGEVDLIGVDCWYRNLKGRFVQTTTMPKPLNSGNWVSVRLAGVKNLKLADGSEVEVKAGTLYGKAIYRGGALKFWVGNRTKVDTIRITWPNGLIQNEVSQPVNRLLSFKEAQRLSGSCPMIWTWNGKEFVFVTDILGVAPLGAASGDGEYFAVDHDEYIQIPDGSLQAADGKYQVRITEELSEVAYLDEVALVSVDHAAGLSVFTGDMFKAPPYAAFKLYGVRERFALRGARQGGVDVLAALSARDRKYAGQFKHGLTGVAELHTLELDLAAGSDLLVLNGWVDWADGSTFLGAAQESKDGLLFPSLEVKQGGEWKSVLADMGMPAGKPKTIVVELPASVSRAGATVRIKTNLSLYWDEIYTAKHEDFAPQVTQLHAELAGTRYRGFSRVEIHPQRLQPEMFFYTPAAATSMWNQTPGKYTRYGDVAGLLDKVDDQYLIMGSGDELQLQFDAARLPALGAGMVRSFLLKVDGWAKDRDANTAYSQSVEPLPFHKMSRYPYSREESFPNGPEHETWRKKYNTRPALRPLRPLALRQ